jgi:hypothetical protein
MCLIAVIPCTLLYKIFYGGSEANPPFTTAQAQTYCSSQITWPWVNQIGDTSSIARSKEARQAVTDDLGVVIPDAFAVILGFVNAVSDGLGDYNNVQKYVKNTPYQHKLR